MKVFIRFSVLILLACMCSMPTFAQKEEKMTIKVYFTDSNDNPNMQDCGKVKAVERTVPKTMAVAKASLHQLFRGPTAKENKAGLFSFFSDKSKHILKGVEIKNGAAYVNFDKWILENLGNATTSCGSASFISEVETTLKQFPTVKKVYFAIENDPEEFYGWMQGECPEELRNCDNSNL